MERGRLPGGRCFVRTIGDLTWRWNIEKILNIGSCQEIARYRQGWHPWLTARVHLSMTYGRCKKVQYQGLGKVGYKVTHEGEAGARSRRAWETMDFIQVQWTSLKSFCWALLWSEIHMLQWGSREKGNLWMRGPYFALGNWHQGEVKTLGRFPN